MCDFDRTHPPRGLGSRNLEKPPSAATYDSDVTRSARWLLLGAGIWISAAVNQVVVLGPKGAVSPAMHAVSSSGSCGRERWSVKTGTDADAGRVNLNSASATTIAYLVSQPHPNSIPSDGRVAPVETTRWSVDATLVEYKLENDSDYHLVISDASGTTMITEIPDPACVGGSSPFRSAIQHARGQFDTRYTPTDFFQRANIAVRISGVGFFDFYHAQTGAAANQVELHPVLDVAFNPGPAPPPSEQTRTAAPTTPAATSPGSSAGGSSPAGGGSSPAGGAGIPPWLAAILLVTILAGVFYGGRRRRRRA